MLISDGLRISKIGLPDQPVGGFINSLNVVDEAVAIDIAQTTAGQNIMLPAPAVSWDNHLLTITNTGTVEFALYSILIAPSETVLLIWNGTIWSIPAKIPITRLSLYPNTRNDLGTPINVLTTDAVGNIESHSISEISAKKAFVVQPLIAGDNIVTHNLAFISPFTSSVEVRDTTTGNLVLARVVPGSRTANTITLNVGAAVASADIILVG